MFTGVPRPYIPQQFRQMVFDSHTHSHTQAFVPLIPSSHHNITGQISIKMYISRLDVVYNVRNLRKIWHHTTAPLDKFKTPEVRFANTHIDIVGPLPEDMFTY